MVDLDVLAKGLTEAQRRDLTSNWDHFCDADHGDIRSDDPNYPDALIAAGYVFIDAVDDDDLETAFAWELGIEAGGLVCRLTPSGLALRAHFKDIQDG